MPDAHADAAEIRAALSRLVDDDPLDDGERALGALPAAARFIERGGLARLRTVAARDADPRAARARATLAAFAAFRAAARGDPIDQFHRGRDTPLGRGDEPRRNDSGDPHR